MGTTKTIHFAILDLEPRKQIVDIVLQSSQCVYMDKPCLSWLLLGICCLNISFHILIVVNTRSYMSSLGITDLGIQALIALDYLFRESEKSSLSPFTH
jgi:hypothetical protein